MMQKSNVNCIVAYIKIMTPVLQIVLKDRVRKGRSFSWKVTAFTVPKRNGIFKPPKAIIFWKYWRKYTIEIFLELFTTSHFCRRIRSNRANRQMFRPTDVARTIEFE